ncbi:hypothetical protein JCM11641_004728 [Rhodosporidiobolus odoratus]
MPPLPPSQTEPPIASASSVDISAFQPLSPQLSSDNSTTPTLADRSPQGSNVLDDDVAKQPGGRKEETGPTAPAKAEKQNAEGVAPPVPYTIHSQGMRWFIVALVSLAGLFSDPRAGLDALSVPLALFAGVPCFTPCIGCGRLSANIYFPVIPTIAENLGTTVEKINISVTVYMIFQGISPSFFGAICDVLGRRPVYIITFIIYLGACAGLANTHSYGLLVVLRCIQAAGSASVIAIGSGSIGDIAPPSERGLFMSIFGLGPMLGPCIGPVFGGLLAGNYGWQSLFWFLFAFGAVVIIIIALLLPETLRSIVGNGSLPAPTLNRSLLSLWQEHRRRKLHGDSKPDAASIAAKPPRKGWKDVKPFAPIKMFREKDVLLTLTFNSVCYTLFYCVTTSTGSTFKATYGLNETELGLCFLANGGGCLIASFLNGPRMTADYRAVARQVEKKRRAEGLTAEEEEAERIKDQNDLSSFPIEHARLRTTPYFFTALIASTIAYGWLLDKGVHLSAPLIMQFIIGLSVTSLFNTVSTLLVDLYPGQSASATAANNLYRCLCGAAGTGFVEPLLNRLGAGWGFTMLSLLNCCFVPLIWLEWKNGMRYRLERAERLARKQEQNEEKEREKGRELERGTRAKEGI